MKKLTAVEWLIHQLINRGLDYQLKEVDYIIEQSKLIEKSQMIEFANKWHEKQLEPHLDPAEILFNEMYKTELKEVDKSQ